MKLLEELRRSSSIYRSDKQRLELAVDNDGSHTSKRVERYVEDSPAGAAWFAPALCVEPAKQSGRADLVGTTARGGKPQP